MTSYTDRDHLDIAKQEYEDYKINQPVHASEGRINLGKVASFQDNTSGNGEQIYTITPNGTADNPQQVEEILF